MIRQCRLAVFRSRSSDMIESQYLVEQSTEVQLGSAGDDGTPKLSLLRLLCRTRTQAGAKLFRQWLANPLVDGPAIRERQAAVQSLLDDVDLLSNVQEVRAPPRDPQSAIRSAARRQACV